jgi:DNA-binding HxlR family transcriptional regulator
MARAAPSTNVPATPLPDAAVRRSDGRANASEDPLPGRPVRGSESGKPIMALLDLLGRRWALRTIWELRDGPLLFRALQARCAGMSSSVLNERLRELRAVGVVDAGAGGYRLTEEGRRLLELFGPLDDWARRWASRNKA